ncbi:MAG: Asp-tRNA(Asn)/Glu-tRNA(Gln) amidotransferase subunit GatC [bacterium]|nr:Asp-tRNA(Asn)/Glu-tRNA(Gln) amidotransferase subunit GatC [bacterium]
MSGAGSDTFTRERVRKVALLSRLEFDDTEADAFAAQLSRILDYVAKLDELNTEGVEPTSHSLALSNVLRPDEPRPSLSNAQALANAPEAEAQCFRVPPIIQEL